MGGRLSCTRVYAFERKEVPIMQQLFPEHRLVDDPAAIYDDIVWPEPADQPYVAVNMVSTIDGRATVAGRVKEIGSPLDRTVMERLRLGVDALLRGAATVRSNPVFPGVPPELVPVRLKRGLNPQPRLVIISSSLDLPWDRRFITDAPQPPIVITTRQAPAGRLRLAEAWAEVHVIGEERVPLRPMLRFLRREYGIRHLLSEGGPQLNGSFLAEDLLDEFFWTVAPRTGGGGSDLALVESDEALPLRNFELVSAFVHQSELFLRYRRVR